MKKMFLFFGALATSVAAFAQEAANVDWSAANTVVTSGQTAISTFVSTNAPIIGTVVLGLLVIPMIFVVAKLIKRAGKQV